MNYDLVRHFQNEIEESKLKMLELLKKTVGGSLGPIMLNIDIIHDAKITVVGIVDINQDNELSLNFGVARCSLNDTFSKKQGREYAKWRALHHPSIQVKVDRASSDEELQNLFIGISHVLNRKFKTWDHISQLAKVPDELKLQFGMRIPVKQKWTEEQIKEAKSKAELAMQGLHERLAGVQP